MKKFKFSYLIFIDALIFIFSAYIAFYLRFEGDIPPRYINDLRVYFLPAIFFKLIMSQFFGLYNRVWKFASVEELFLVGVNGLVSNFICISAFYFLQVPAPRSVLVLITFMEIAGVGAVRFSIRGKDILSNKITFGFSSSKFLDVGLKKVLIVGAGSAGSILAKEFNQAPSNRGIPVGFVDDDDEKIGKKIYSLNVLGSIDAIPEIVENFDVSEVIIAIPSASQKEKTKVINICKSIGVSIQTLPAIHDIVGGKVEFSSLRKVNIEDLLGRDKISLDTENIRAFIEGKCVMITGAAGTIGSEIARQIIAYKPSLILLLDVNENGLHALGAQMNEMGVCQLGAPSNKSTKSGALPNVGAETVFCSSLRFITLLASVREKSRLNEIFDKYHPNIVFHAAAHKHVPMMEISPKEAIKNNVFGTLNMVRSALTHGVDKFVLISTDKADNPTNVMGASKRLCELIVQTYNAASAASSHSTTAHASSALDSAPDTAPNHSRPVTEFACVRFGNVLGSAGSVIPTFEKQIKAGGPVTVTHPDIIRYFMLIPEAVQLVLEAGAMAKGGEIFVLDMGEPVKIIDLAKDMIRLSGLKPYEDIDIKIVGLRPGEKLYEELLTAEEGLKATKNEKIFIGKPEDTDMNHLKKMLAYIDVRDDYDFEKCGEARISEKDGSLSKPSQISEDVLRRRLQEILPTYKPQQSDDIETTTF